MKYFYHQLSKLKLKAIPVRTEGGIITLRSESENAKEILDKMNIPYPGKIINSILTL